jgi:hypothetical protein
LLLLQLILRPSSGNFSNGECKTVSRERKLAPLLSRLQPNLNKRFRALTHYLDIFIRVNASSLRPSLIEEIFSEILIKRSSVTL